MSKRRIIGCLVVRQGIVVQSIGFERYLPVGQPEIAARFFDSWGVDEILLIDIDARREERLISEEIVARVAQAIHTPLTVGGGIRGVDDVHRIIATGADKISINGLLLDDLEEVSRIGQSYGVQCVVGCIDVLRDSKGGLRVYADGGHRATSHAPAELAKRAADAGVGEILVNTIHKDGMCDGFDVDLIASIVDSVDIPVIGLGGAGHPRHFLDAMEATDVSALAAANFLHYTEHSIATIKSYLRDRGVDVRCDAEADYRGMTTFCDDGRIGRRAEESLLDEIFEYIPKEVI